MQRRRQCLSSAHFMSLPSELFHSSQTAPLMSPPSPNHGFKPLPSAPLPHVPHTSTIYLSHQHPPCIQRTEPCWRLQALFFLIFDTNGTHSSESPILNPFSRNITRFNPPSSRGHPLLTDSSSLGTGRVLTLKGN